MNQETHRRSHLTKEQRLPQSYKEVEKILNVVKRCEANVKTVLHNSKLRGAVLHKVSGLTFSVLKQRRLLDSIIERTQILEKEPYLRKELAGILIHELIFGNGLPGKSKPVETVLRYQADIEKAHNDLKSDDSLFNSLLSIPKYVRVNTLAITLPEVLEDLEYLGVRQIVFDANISEEEFYELVKNLEKTTFLLDYHFKDLLIFNGDENLTTWSLYQKGHVFIQDKSSYIPAYVLAPPPGATVIDACAAPGMKTLHLTALMENNGVIYAFEKDQQRFEILNKMLKSGHADICQTFCGDFNLVDPRDEKYSSVEYILLDPSCSGSGMVNRMDYITDTKESKNDLRIQKLAGFQIILLKHALLFPSVKRVVYSTCSITETENEFVVHEVLNHFDHRFKLSPVLPDWSIRGSNNFEFGAHCLRAYPDKCFTNGFFVAMFERLEDFEIQHQFEKKQGKLGKRKHFSDPSPKDLEPNNEEELFDYDLKSLNESVDEERRKDSTLDNTLAEVVEEEMPLKKKHKKKHKSDKIASMDVEHIEVQEIALNNDMMNDNFTSTIEETKFLKKHKSKHDKKHSEHINKNDTLIAIEALESETKNNDIQDDIFDNDIQKINLKNKKRKKHDKDFESNTNLDNIQIPEVQAQSIFDSDVTSEVKPDKKKSKDRKKSCNNSFCDSQITQSLNIEERTLTETAPEIKMLHKKKKHKRQHEKEDSNNSFCETQKPEVQIKTSNVDNDIFKETVEKVESSHKKKKKHKSKHEEDSNNSFCEKQNQETENEISYVDYDISTETVQKVESLHKKKKKNKSKREKGEYDNSFCEIKNIETQIEISNVDNDNFTETPQNVESSGKKKKKQKSKREKEDSNNNICETQNPEAHIEISNIDNDILPETVQIVEFSSREKKKHKRKHVTEECNNSFYETQTSEVLQQNSNFEKDILTDTVQKMETPHKKKKHKRKHEIETSN